MKTILSKKIFLRATLSFLFLFLFVIASAYAQSFEVRGVVKGKSSTETETIALSDVNVYLKGTLTGTTTNRKGEFRFPKKLKSGDVLVFSYLGYQKKQIKLQSNSTFLTVILEEDDNTLLGAPRSNKRYKSKRSKQ
ncbi:carboxypeptidase-like regulatory domain-containing protein [Pseudotenacibaculum sp. MALMAid0570]|uniref:carboxypeptidase-like regulatory domain-containing protein n=1 Tax=Pseudotenacibaculum sp. MALMAid0570 TaxID=3143938 RepID=UPI0032E04756